MRRPQFSLKTLLWLMAVVAALFGGMALQRKLDEPEWVYKSPPTNQPVLGGEYRVEIMKLRDGSEWIRMVQPIGDSPDMPGKQPAWVESLRPSED